MSKQQQQEQVKRAVITAQGMIDNAPSTVKVNYVRIPKEWEKRLKFFNPEKGKTYHLIFLPWKAGRNNPVGREGNWVVNRYLSVHRSIGPNEDHHLCTLQTLGKPCAVCEEYLRLRALGNGDDYYKKVLAPIKTKQRELFLVHDCDDNRNPENLMIWDESTFLFGDNFRLKINKKELWKAFADFDQGLMVEVEAREKKMGMGTCVDCSNGIELEDRRTEYDPLPEWMIQAAEEICVDKFVVETPYAKLKRVFENTGGARELEEPKDLEETPEATNPNDEEPWSPRKKKEEESDEIVEGEVDEPPVKETKKPTKKPAKK